MADTAEYVHSIGKLITQVALSVCIYCLIYTFCDIGTLIGGCTGMTALFVIHAFSIFRLPSLQYLLISLCIVPQMYIAKAIKKNLLSAVLRKNDSRKLLSITPLVFLAISCAKAYWPTSLRRLSIHHHHARHRYQHFRFAMNRILDTSSAYSFPSSSISCPWGIARLLYIKTTSRSKTRCPSSQSRLSVHKNACSDPEICKTKTQIKRFEKTFG